METLPRETIVDVLEHRLREDILTGRHPAGSYLPPERSLADGYGVTAPPSSTPSADWSRRGLLETRHGVGTRVRDYARLGGADLLPMLVRHSPDWIGEIFEVRRGIGALIAERAAARSDPEAVTELRRLLDAVRESEGGDAVQLADAEVHRALARATGNRVYVLLTNTLFNAYLPVRAALVGPFTDPEAAYTRLAPVVEAGGGGRRPGRTRGGGRLSDRDRADRAGRPGVSGRGTEFRETLLGTFRLDGECRTRAARLDLRASADTVLRAPPGGPGA
ncbi:FCD domain-containing protein [Streptomyces sp. BPTC-684]|uniref:FadR/GntR family transcriptional regulator n=1 Tax=Streptomyces sp. BPTC-684 TaxID=3043734 RepID=UPI0024B14018|nr:FCD domain-containing protein [Streptomyces sp. BPTC-684]WHM40166.1 FCD domain-containing protein [Streptomyces sp. BPTC-684]